MQSPDDPQVALIAFFLQMPQGMSDNVVHKDALKAIVNSDMSSIGGSMGSTILSVGPLPSTTETSEPTLNSGTDAFKDKKEDDESDGESKPTNVIIVASVGCVIFFLIIIIALLLGFKKGNR